MVLCFNIVLQQLLAEARGFGALSHCKPLGCTQTTASVSTPKLKRFYMTNFHQGSYTHSFTILSPRIFRNAISNFISIGNSHCPIKR